MSKRSFNVKNIKTSDIENMVDQLVEEYNINDEDSFSLSLNLYSWFEEHEYIIED